MIYLLLLALRLAIALTVAVVGFVLSRRYVENRLRYVDAVQSPFAAFVAGGIATIIAIPLTFLPLVSLVTAIGFGVGVFSGVASGAREIRKRLGAG